MQLACSANTASKVHRSFAAKNAAQDDKAFSMVALFVGINVHSSQTAA
jgi:hypothetical protein